MATIVGTFPYKEHRSPSDDLFLSFKDALAAGWPEDQVWSVTPFDDGNGWIFGPPHHWLNVVGYVATAERHDHDTYYEEPFDD